MTHTEPNQDEKRKHRGHAAKDKTTPMKDSPSRHHHRRHHHPHPQQAQQSTIASASRNLEALSRNQQQQQNQNSISKMYADPRSQLQDSTVPAASRRPQTASTTSSIMSLAPSSGSNLLSMTPDSSVAASSTSDLDAMSTAAQDQLVTVATHISVPPPGSTQETADYKLLLTPMFSAMTRITDNLFLTGVGGMTKENFRKNHIDFVVNITTEAPFWEGLESMRLPLEDDSSVNILAYFDVAVDKIHEAITKRNAHVLVHCVAGVSRSAAIVIAYLMKIRRLDLQSAFNHCYHLRPVIRPNNGFMRQLILYEQQLFGKNTVRMVDADVDGIMVNVPHFFIDEHPRLVLLEVYRVRDKLRREADEQQQQQPQLKLQQQRQDKPKSKTAKG